MIEIEKRISVISWNTLYRKYEELYNPTSQILKTYPDDSERISDIVSVIQHVLTTKTVVCLQECNNQLFHLLQTNINTHDIFKNTIRDDECLITMTPKNTFVQEENMVHPSSNGYLTVSNDKYRIVNCHLIPQRYASVSVLDYIKNIGTENGKTTIIAGDFNEYRQKISQELQNKYTIPKYGKTYKNREIDYIIINKKNLIYETLIIETNLSDHRAIIFNLY